MDLYTIAAFSIVGVDDLDMVPQIEILEKDSFGRVFFQIVFRNPVFYPFYSNKSVETMRAYAYVICQKTENDRVYYYEDDCFRVFANQKEFTTAERDELKRQNDWDIPLVEEKLTYRKIIKPNENKITAMNLDYDNAFDMNLYKEDLAKALSPVPVRGPLFTSYLDCNARGKSLIVAWQYTNDSETNEINISSWFLIAESDAIQTKKGVAIQCFDIEHYWEELKVFKNDNQW